MLLRKPRSKHEVYNDLDGEIVNVFRVLRDSSMSEELKHKIKLTPFSRSEFKVAMAPSACPVEQARRTITRSYLGFSGATTGKHPGFRTKAWRRDGSSAVYEWMSYYDRIDAFTNRLSGVVLEEKPAMEVVSQMDDCDVLFYVDPPYLIETRNSNSDQYRFEMTTKEHEQLLSLLLTLRGKVVLSGYPSGLYDAALSGWKKVKKISRASSFVGSAEREECLWLSPNREEERGLFALIQEKGGARENTSANVQ